jgi:hypothetical protein
MAKKRKQNVQPSENKQTDEANKPMSVNETDLIKKQEDLKEIEASLVQKENSLAQREKDLKTAKEAISRQELELNNKRVNLDEIELQAKNGFPKLFEEQYADFKKQLEQREAHCSSEWESLEGEKQSLRQRELEIQKAEIVRDHGYADDRAKLDEELHSLRKKQEDELVSKRARSLDAIEKELVQLKKARLSDLDIEILELEKMKDDLEHQEQRLQSRKDTISERESSLNTEVEIKLDQRKQSFENEKTALTEEIERLRGSIRTSNTLVASFDELKRKLGDEDPAAVLLKLKTYEEEIKNLREELTSRPTKEMQESFDRINTELNTFRQACERLSEENDALNSVARSHTDLEMQVAELSEKNKSLKRRFEAIDADNNRLVEDLRRLQSSYEREQDRDARIRDIETPYLQKELTRSQNLLPEATSLIKLESKRIRLMQSEEKLSDSENEKHLELDKLVGSHEIEWLDGINGACLDYGLRFPRRILHAFHTALKTSEWSPITVLAGVSGTGKSELPRLYSHFGGVNFLSLSVQPNWDSQESMLGFFNSIDNKFDAQPVIRLLAQSQKPKTEEYPFGFEDVISLILMDEMNLAHVELYFAEFLSKLELRRGRKGSEVPNLDVKLGAGIQHYQLPLGRNVLWAGTMNQDETTKSLSDKVLDRGIVINFPRPTTLERRKELKALGEPAALLSRKLWESWWCRESKFTDDQILPFKGFVEEMNSSLSRVGRALGHRVWQSIEYYMSNYPDVMQAQRNNDDAELVKAMKIAFEDQLVQKVMPKLRGIETRGKAKSDCLDKIRAQLVNDDYTIIEDFDLACEFGYGQFIWNSANYLKDEERSQPTASIDDVSHKDDLEQSETQNNSSQEPIPENLISFAKEKSKELWQLTKPEIKKALSCDVKEATRLKSLCNKTKKS